MFQNFADAGVLSDVFVGHSNAIWGLSYDGTKNNLVSCSGDGTVRLWSPQSKSPLLNTYTADTGELLKLISMYMGIIM